MNSSLDELSAQNTVDQQPSKWNPFNREVACKGVALPGSPSAIMQEETNDLLRRRLKMASLMLFAGFFAFLVKRFVEPTNHLDQNAVSLEYWSHIIMTIATGFTWIRLQMGCRFVLSHLRIFELVIFGGSAVFFGILTYFITVISAEFGYAARVAGPWLLLIFTYALFIPNRWQRAAWIIGAMGLAPNLVLLYTYGTAPIFGSGADAKIIAQADDCLLETFMLMTLGSTIAIWGVSYQRLLRKEAFDARQLGQYRLKGMIGSGGMGEVYLAEHTMLKRPCALKLIRPSKANDPKTLIRFEREVKATSRLTHWNTVEIYDYGRAEDGTFYYVMEYLKGVNLDELIRRWGPMSAERAIHFLTQTCEALQEAHSLGLIHRDIKPANIFAAERGGKKDVTKLLDFGLVKTVSQVEDSQLTQHGTITGSPLFMSPEQATGGTPDDQSDIYSLGAVGFFLLTGRELFPHKNTMKVIVSHAAEQPPKPSDLEDGIPADLEAVIMKCLEKDPGDRFTSALQLRDALLECQAAEHWSEDDAEVWWNDHPVVDNSDESTEAMSTQPTVDSAPIQQTITTA